MRGILPFLLVLVAVAFFTRVDFFFYLLYTLAGVYILGRLWARWSLASVSVQRHHDHRVFLEQSFSVLVKMHNRAWLPVLWLRLSDNLPPELAPGGHFRRIVSMLPGERLELIYILKGRRRGYYQIGPLIVQGGDLLGTATFEYRHPDDQEENEEFVIVYPRIVALHELGFPSQSPFGILPSRERIFEDPTRIQGVRDYQPGDSLRRMDWKSSARIGALQVRRYEPAIALETATFLNLDAGDYDQAERRHATELGIITAASLAVHLVEMRQAVGLITNGHDPLAEDATDGSFLPQRKGRVHLMHLLDLLARVKVAPEGTAVPFLTLLTRKSLGLPWGSTVILVTSREVEGLMDALLTLRRRGLVIILALTCQDREFEVTSQRASQIGVHTQRLWSEQDLDVWR